MLDARVDLSFFLKASDVLLRSADPKTLHESIRPALMRDQKEHRVKQAGPGGQWRPLSPFTIERQKARARAKGKRRPRKMLGKLPTAFKVFTTSQSVAMVSRAKWSSAHQEGATNAGRAPTIPERRFFWISDKARRAFVEIIEGNLQKAWGF